MLSPKEIASNYVQIGKNKAETSWHKQLLLGIMAGMFVSLAAVGANTASCMVENAGMAKLIAALLFPAGLAMVIFAGSELFTGGCLMIISVLERKVKWGSMLRCWLMVYIGNFIGSIFIAWMVNQGGQLSLFNSHLAMTTIKTAATKTGLTFESAFILGIFCNFLVCIAVWIGSAGSSIGDKLLGIYFPVVLFVISGFEHSVANMYYIPVGIFAKNNPAYSMMAVSQGIVTDGLNWGNFVFRNLIPVTLGNIVGGAVLVGGAYWLLYLKDSGKKKNI